MSSGGAHQLKASAHSLEKLYHFVVAEVRIRPRQSFEASTGKYQGHLGENTPTDVDPMIQFTTRGHNQIIRCQKAGINVYCAKMKVIHTVGEERFYLVAGQFYICET